MKAEFGRSGSSTRVQHLEWILERKKADLTTQQAAHKKTLDYLKATDAENVRLREALAFYAGYDVWAPEFFGEEGAATLPSRAERDCGERARKALEDPQ